jgi:hypothetical protein
VKECTCKKDILKQHNAKEQKKLAIADHNHSRDLECFNPGTSKSSHYHRVIDKQVQ